MKTLIMKEEQSRKEAEKLEASRLMAEAEEAKSRRIWKSRAIS